MRLSTRRGDRGGTSLLGGRVVPKDDPRVELLGTLDEVVSYLGLAKSGCRTRSLKAALERVQKDLFLVAAEAATCSCKPGALKSRIGSLHVQGLERSLDIWEPKISGRRSCFALPGREVVSAHLDVARALVRRAERRVVTLTRRKELTNAHLLIYLNRLSDLLYVWARISEER